MNSYASFLREDQARTERWAHLTEGVKDDYQKKILETLLDNEQAIIGKHGKFEATDTSDVAVFTRIAKPLIRRIFPNLIANQLVSIQPISMPTAKVFFLDYKFTDANAPTAAGDRMDYEAGKMNSLYSSGVIKGESIGTGNAAATVFNLKYHPVKVGSVVVKKDAVVTGTTVDYVNGTVTFGVAPANGAVLTADYSLSLENVGTSGTAKIPEIELEMSSATVETESKKIKAKWSIEAEQDFQAYHNLALESLLTEQLGDQVKREIDRMIIDDLMASASAANSTWHYTVPGSGYTAKEWAETLVGAIGDASNEIYKKRLRHANFVVMGPDSANRLDKLNSFRMNGFTGNGGSGTVNIGSGPAVFGTLTNRYTVIVDPLFASDKILVGYKGESWTDTGYVYSPYAAFNTQTFIDPNTMQPVKGLMSRFGRHLVNGDFYATVTIAA